MTLHVTGCLGRCSVCSGRCSGWSASTALRSNTRVKSAIVDMLTCFRAEITRRVLWKQSECFCWWWWWWWWRGTPSRNVSVRFVSRLNDHRPHQHVDCYDESLVWSNSG